MTATCVVAGCRSPVHSVGLCSKHEFRWRRHGTVDDSAGRYGGRNVVAEMTPAAKARHLKEMAEWVRREALFPTLRVLAEMANDVSS